MHFVYASFTSRSIHVLITHTHPSRGQSSAPTQHSADDRHSNGGCVSGNRSDPRGLQPPPDVDFAVCHDSRIAPRELLIVLYSITSVVIARSAVTLRKFADAQVAECSQVVHPIDLETAMISGSLDCPAEWTRIARWNAECLAADAYIPAPIGSLASVQSS